MASGLQVLPLFNRRSLQVAIEDDWLEVRWPLPSTSVQRFTELPLNRYVTIVEGQRDRDLTETVSRSCSFPPRGSDLPAGTTHASYQGVIVERIPECKTL